MSVFNSNGVSTLTVDDETGAAKNITAYVKEIDGVEKLYALLDSTSLADTAEKATIGIQQALTLSVKGDYNDVADGPHDIFSAIVGKESYTSSIQVVLDGTNKFTFEAICTRYAPTVKNKELVGYEATLVSDGAIGIS